MDCNQTRKEKKSARELVAHMKSKGITFDKIGEDDAVSFLRTKNNYFRVGAFRKLFPKHEGGASNGCYISLDFGDLVQLSYVDQALRSTLRMMSLDLEHYEKVALLDRIAEDDAEDAYSIVRDYKASLAEGRRRPLERELSARRGDVYCGDLLSKYSGDMPAWVFLEVASFGTFTDFCRFCSKRWDDSELRDLHFMLLKAKSIRNAASHGACIINGFAEKGARSRQRSRLPRKTSNMLGEVGLSKARREKWLDNPRMRDIVALACLFSARVAEGKARDAVVGRLSSFYKESAERLRDLPSNNPAVAGIDFMKALTDGLSLK